MTEQEFAELQAGFDAFHTARARTSLVADLYAEAAGDLYPVEVAPNSSCDWPLLGAMVARLRLAPGQLLADVGCGTGGVGLWLARALAVRLVGVDISPVAVQLAITRSPAFVTDGQAAFRTGTLASTGLADQHVHGVVCVDALSCAPDRAAALHEMYRILAPGGRAIITRAARRDAHTLLTRHEEAAGFTVEHIVERAGEPAVWARLYRLWIAREADLRRELGDVQAERMLAEASRVLPRLAGRRAVVLTLRRPAVTTAAAGTLPEPA
ncbi:class I SAM-dependent methyltransferase [Streptomyces aureoverticillatus]|uniref:class I SAM-dependent methyltransferase n=1 Tax=Streptomyces aureoverticillatus TaxID=66871 RepID=UPI0013DBC52A|nr:class I SAM-dependent methyltransferase [Streptomyces aureoverticillatus]QIB49543.1 class I SAM-dependent methyltransferase [Streptomyces aureoverticillatus]